jgi:hypothetical protein
MWVKKGKSGFKGSGLRVPVADRLLLASGYWSLMSAGSASSQEQEAGSFMNKTQKIKK